MARVAQRVTDKVLLRLIGRYLRAGVKCQLHRRMNLKALSSLIKLLKSVERSKTEEIAADSKRQLSGCCTNPMNSPVIRYEDFALLQ